MMNSAEQNDEPTDPELLLPWYATGQLSEAETACVEAWLKSNQQAMDHLLRSREEMDLTVGDARSLGAPRAEALSALMARIAVEKPAVQARPGWTERIAGFFTPRVLAYTAAALVAVFVVQTATIGVLLQREAPVFETASAPAETLPDGLVVLVAFQPSAMIEQINELLNGSGAVIVGGPDPAGIYRIAVPQGADAEALLDGLATSPLVGFFAKTQEVRGD